MTRLFLCCFAVLLFSNAVLSQGCNPAWSQLGFIYPPPDSQRCVIIDESFSGAFQINEPSSFGSMTVDSLVVDSITGFPSGLTWFSSPSPLVIYGDSSVCISIIGTTYNEIDSGNYPLTFYGKAVVTSQASGTQTLSFAQAQQQYINIVPYYQLVAINTWDSCIPVSYSAPLAIGNVISADDWNIYPNPGSGNFNVSVSMPGGFKGQLAVCDILGRFVYRRDLEATGHYQTGMDLADVSSGMYVVQLVSGDGTVQAAKPLVIRGSESPHP